MNLYRVAAIAGAAAMIVVLPARHAVAQTGMKIGGQSLSMAFRAGPSLPVDKLSKITDPGAAFGADLAYALTNRLAVTANGDLDALTGHTSLEPDLSLWHYGGGLQLDLAPLRTPWSVLLTGEADATTMHTGPIGPDSNTSFNHTYLGLDGGLEIGYNVSHSVNVAVRGSSFFVFADKQDTAALTNGTGAQPFSTAVTIPVTAELHIALPNG
jgi:hypothetical protein